MLPSEFRLSLAGRALSYPSKSAHKQIIMPVIRLNPDCIQPLPSEPQLIMESAASEVETGLIESPEERLRRQEWIRYFVFEKHDYGSAWDLGWDGKPFQRSRLPFGQRGESAAKLTGGRPHSSAAASRSTRSRPM